MDQLEGVLSETPVGDVELDTASLVDRSVRVEQTREQCAPLPLGAAEIDLRDVLATEDSHAAQDRVHRAVITVTCLAPAHAGGWLATVRAGRRACRRRDDPCAPATRATTAARLSGHGHERSTAHDARPGGELRAREP